MKIYVRYNKIMITLFLYAATMTKARQFMTYTMPRPTEKILGKDPHFVHLNDGSSFNDPNQ